MTIFGYLFGFLILFLYAATIVTFGTSGALKSITSLKYLFTDEIAGGTQAKYLKELYSSQVKFLYGGAFIGVIIVLLPVVGACLLWSRWRLTAAWLITLAMLASLIFGLLNHFVLDSVDNVVSVPEHEWRHGFVFSAAMVAVSETAGTVIGAVAVWLWGRTLDVAR